MFDGIIGHQSVRTFLERSIANQRIAHAYLFLGPAHVGKTTVARAFAETLLHGASKSSHSLETHPDVVWVSRQLDEKTEELKANIAIGQIRELRERLSYTSLLPGWKIAFIEDADTLTAEAANALLKTLEEPQGKTLIMLLATDVRAVPQTVRSRTQLVRFGLVRREELEAGLLARGAKKTEAVETARLARGRVGTALELLADREMRQELVRAAEERRDLLGLPEYQRMQWIERHLKGVRAGSLEEEFRLWQEILRDELLARLGLPELITFPGGVSTAQETGNDLRRFHRLSEAEAAARHHVDARLAFEHFLLT